MNKEQVYSVPIIKFSEFRERLLDQLAGDMTRNDGYVAKDIFEILLTDGFPKLDKDDIAKFFKELKLFLFMDTVAVDIGNRDWYWLVSGRDAILVRIPGTQA